MALKDKENSGSDTPFNYPTSFFKEAARFLLFAYKHSTSKSTETGISADSQLSDPEKLRELYDNNTNAMVESFNTAVDGLALPEKLAVMIQKAQNLANGAKLFSKLDKITTLSPTAQNAANYIIMATEKLRVALKSTKTTSDDLKAKTHTTILKRTINSDALNAYAQISQNLRILSSQLKALGLEDETNPTPDLAATRDSLLKYLETVLQLYTSATSDVLEHKDAVFETTIVSQLTATAAEGKVPTAESQEQQATPAPATLGF